MFSKHEKYDLIREALAEARMGANNWLRMNCPFCVIISGKDDKRWSLGVKPDNGYAHCFKCGTALRLPESMRDEFARDYEAEDEEAEEQPDGPTPIPPPEGYTPLWREPALTADVAKVARTYLRARGFGRGLWQAAQIGVCLTGYYKHRIIVPILSDDESIWLGYAARDFTGVGIPKYLFPPGMPRGTALYQHNVLLKETDVPAMLVEGVFDVLPYFGDACAFLGKPTKWQKEALLLAKRPLVSCLDGDAKYESYALCQWLRLNGKEDAGYVELPAKEDPCSVAQKMGVTWLMEAARAACER